MLITGQSGLVAGTHVASNQGWRMVETLRVGDKVLTFDNGLRRVVEIQRERLALPETPLTDGQAPVLVPEGALFNRRPLWLMPEQGMMVECDATMDAMGEPYAVVPARSLSGLRGIAPGAPGTELEIVTLAFEQDEVIYVEGGMLAWCPRPEQIWMPDTYAGPRLYEMLDDAASARLVNYLIAQDDAHALASNPSEMPGFQEAPARPGRPILI